MRVLLLISPETYRASDFLAAARALRLEVTVATPSAGGAIDLAPGAYLRLPFDDPEAAARAARRFAATVPVDAVVAVDEQAVVAGAAVAAALGRPHHPLGAARATRDKAAQRRRLADAAVPVPPFAAFDGPAALEGALAGDRWPLPFPCVIKPVAGSASRGVLRADDPVALRAAAARVAAILEGDGVAARLLVEGYVDGAELTVEGLLDHGALEVLARFDKPDPMAGPTFEETLFVTPSRQPEAVLARVDAAVAAGCRALGLETGPIHAELRVDAAGRPWILEIAARTIGGLCARTLRFGAGTSLEALVLRQAAGLPLEAPALVAGAAGVLMLPVPRRGILRRVDGVPAARKVPGIEGIEITATLGAEVVPLPEGRRYLGFVFARGTAPAGVEAALRAAWAHLVPVIDPA